VITTACSVIGTLRSGSRRSRPAHHIPRPLRRLCRTGRRPTRPRGWAGPPPTAASPRSPAGAPGWPIGTSGTPAPASSSAKSGRAHTRHAASARDCTTSPTIGSTSARDPNATTTRAPRASHPAGSAAPAGDRAVRAGLDTSPRVPYTVKVERACSRQLGSRRLWTDNCSRSGGAPRTAVPSAQKHLHGLRLRPRIEEFPALSARPARTPSRAGPLYTAPRRVMSVALAAAAAGCLLLATVLPLLLH
jgi:hypothetical protein